jgi:hypothetical protein
VGIFVPPKPLRAMAPAVAAAVKAGPIGPGAGVLITEYPLSLLGRQSPQDRMRRYWALGIEVGWVNRAESAIAERFAGAEWHLEDENDEEIDDETADPEQKQALQLTEKPALALAGRTQPYYRSGMMKITSRAMGLCGSAFIVGDANNGFEIPTALLPIAPWRMYPDEDADGNVVGWNVDKTATNPGTPLSLDQVYHFKLQDDFTSHFGIGLVQSALTKMANSTALDNHLALLLSAGGRLSGVMSPKSGIIEGEAMQQMERDWRSIVEQNDAAKRLQLIRAPIEFTKTTLSPAELQVATLMTQSRDDLLTLWEVPLSIVGGTPPTGLNSGDSRKYDEAAIWQGPVHDRLGIFREVMQYQLYDRYAAVGSPVEYEIDEPEFDDDSPRYDLLQKSVNTPMRNAERRALIGLDPLGIPALDDEIILPVTQVPYALAPSEEGQASASAIVQGRTSPQLSEEADNEAQTKMAMAGETAQPSATGPQQTGVGTSTAAAGKAAGIGKAVPQPAKTYAGLHQALVRLRSHAETRYIPRLKQDVGAFLDSQQRDIAGRVRRHAAHLAENPNDSAVWWDGTRWDRALSTALAGPLSGMAEAVNGTIAAVMPEPGRKAGPLTAVERTLQRGAARVTRINESTRDRVQSIITTGISNDLTMLQIADAIEQDESGLFDTYRSELISRTELMDSYNATALGSYGDAGIEMVEAIDGDEDEECADRVANNPYTLEDADAEEDHPNGTLDWVPYVEDAAVAEDTGDEEGKAAPLQIVRTDWRDAMKAAIDAAPPTVVVHVPAPIVNIAPPQIEPPVVVVQVPDQSVEVHVPAQAAPIVNVPAQEPPIVVVQPPSDKPRQRRSRTITPKVDGSYTVTED